MLLGLLASLAFWPGVIGATIPAGWAVLSCYLPTALWRSGPFSLLHMGLLATLAYAVASFGWTVNWYSSVWGLWMLSMFCLAYWLGSTLKTLRPVLVGLAFGAWVSSVVAITQALGSGYVLAHNFSVPSGLHFNPVAQGLFIALLIVALASHRMWFYIPFVAPGLLLSQSRGAYAACALGLLAIYVRKPLVLLILCLAVAVVVTYQINIKDSERLAIWAAAWSHIPLFGNGIGTFIDLWFLHDGRPRHPEYTHNDFLQLAFELGIGAIPIGLAMCLPAFRTTDREWPLLIAFLFAACFAFPSYLPLTALLGALAAGRIAGDWSDLWLTRPASRYGLLSRIPATRPAST